MDGVNTNHQDGAGLHSDSQQDVSFQMMSVSLSTNLQLLYLDLSYS